MTAMGTVTKIVLCGNEATRCRNEDIRTYLLSYRKHGSQQRGSYNDKVKQDREVTVSQKYEGERVKNCTLRLFHE